MVTKLTIMTAVVVSAGTAAMEFAIAVLIETVKTYNYLPL